jgi:hypothetical protein
MDSLSWTKPEHLRGRERLTVPWEIEIAPWNAKHISLKDPFGNVLGINQDLLTPPET